MLQTPVLARTRHDYSLPAIQQPGQFVDALAHEIRNPLANINLSVEMLKSLIKDKDLKTYLDIINRNSIRINNLVSEFLSYPLAGEVQTGKYSIHQLLEGVIETVKDRIRLRGVVVGKIYDIQDHKITLNESQMKIALTNVMINAIESMALGEGELKVITRSINGKCMIEIEDNGCGIEKENLKHIFKPFYSSKKGGLGIGLSTTFRIFQAHNVEVMVKSEKGEGTRFILLFNNSD